VDVRAKVLASWRGTPGQTGGARSREWQPRPRREGGGPRLPWSTWCTVNRETPRRLYIKCCEPHSRWPLPLATSACLIRLASLPVLILPPSPRPRRSRTDQSAACPAQCPYLRWSPLLWVAPPVFPACITSDTRAAFSGGGPAALGAAPLPNLDPFKYACTTAGGQNRQEVRTGGQAHGSFESFEEAFRLNNNGLEGQ
jgi:hypothetical protein